jgi:hypothetical protein
MKRKGLKTITEFGIKFKFSKYIDQQKKEIIEQHPQSKDNFRFTRNKNNSLIYAFFIRSNDSNQLPKEKHRNKSLFE